jgi:hypothetical protein
MKTFPADRHHLARCCHLFHAQSPLLLLLFQQLATDQDIPSTNPLQSEEWCITNNKPASHLLEARLAPDMKPLTFQVHTAANMAHNALLGPDWTFHEDWPKEADQNTFAALQAKIQDAITAVQEADVEVVEKGMAEPLTLWISGEFFAFSHAEIRSRRMLGCC